MYVRRSLPLAGKEEKTEREAETGFCRKLGPHAHDATVTERAPGTQRSGPGREYGRAMSVEYRVLGPLEVSVDGRPARLGAPKQRATLVLLLCRPNIVVPASRLIDGLWGDYPPGSAANLVQGYVSGLRKTLGKEAIETRGAGYVASRRARGSRSATVRGAGAPRRSGTRGGGCGPCLVVARRGTRTVARPGARRPRGRPLAGSGLRTSRGAPRAGARAAGRGGPRPRAPCRRRGRGRRADRRASAPRAPPRSPDDGALPVRPPGGRARAPTATPARCSSKSSASNPAPR